MPSLICVAVCAKEVPAVAPLYPPASLHPLLPLHPTASKTCLATKSTKGWGCCSIRQSILPLAGPGSPCTLVNHLPNNEAAFTPPAFSPLPPVFFCCCGIKKLIAFHKPPNRLVVKVSFLCTPLFPYPSNKPFLSLLWSLWKKSP